MDKLPVTNNELELIRLNQVELKYKLLCSLVNSEDATIEEAKKLVELLEQL